MQKRLFFFFMSMLLIVSTAWAQHDHLSPWTWDSYNTKFSVPDDFRVTKSSGTEFSATNDRLTLSIYPRTDEHLSYSAMKNAVVKWARQNNVRYSKSPEYMEDLNGYWGCYIDGSVQGYPTSLLLLIDPDYPDTSLYIWLAYSSDETDTAVAILQSFVPN